MFRALVPDSLKRRLRKFIWMRLNPMWTLPSGIVIRVLSYSDWMIYNDIFVDGEYDEPVNRLLETSDDTARTARVLDLGANVGFFTLRLADAFLRKRRNDFSVIAVEGSPANHIELSERLDANSQFLSGRVRAINGLAGHRTGEGEISEGESCGENTLFNQTARRVKAPFVDLDELTREWAIVDLLKCDIEGAEELFLRNYPDLLAKTEYAVLEFHHDKCDVVYCRQLLTDAGLKETVIVREFGRCSVEFFRRER